jgi:hypothetical protein
MPPLERQLMCVIINNVTLKLNSRDINFVHLHTILINVYIILQLLN